MACERRIEHLLIGGGIACATAARTLREEGADGSILLVGRELDPPYHRPPISKGYLQGAETRADTLIHEPDWWERNDVELLTRTSVVEIDGGAYVGAEVAASLTVLGKRCTIVMQESATLERHFGARAGRHFQSILEAHGVEVIGEEEVERFEGDGERVQRVVTRGGRSIAADAVVCGVGAIPDVMLARKSGFELGPSGGVLASSRLETSHPGIYAAGDICEYESTVHGRALRIEHEDHAAEQGRTAARNMLGRDRPHQAVPYFFSDLADWVSLEYVGPAAGWDEEVVRGSLDDGDFTLFYLQDTRVVAALGVGRSVALDHARRLIVEATPIADPATLAVGDLGGLGGQ